MTAPNHIAGGLVITSLLGTLFFRINIFASPLAIFCTCLFSLLPDIDHTKSIIGRCPGLTWISSWLNRKYGHRTITHSLIFLSALTFLFAIVENVFFHHYQITIIFFLSYFSHLLLDTLTLQGVPLFYPFSKTPHVLISNPQMRMRSGNYRAETIAFFIFIILQISLLSTGLIERGFWTTYNQTFATTKHIYSEFSKADDLLAIDFQYKEGTELFVGTGYLIESTPNKATLLMTDSLKQLYQDTNFPNQKLLNNASNFPFAGLKSSWLILNNNSMNIQSVVPHHTGKQFYFTEQTFLNITADSLNQLTQLANIRHLDVTATNEFFVQNSGVGERKTSFKGDHLSNISFQVDQSSISKETYIYQSNPRIRSLHRQIQNLQQQDQLAQSTHQKKLAELLDLEINVFHVTDLYRREKMQKRIHELRKLKKPVLSDSKIKEFQAQIAGLQTDDYLKNQEKRLAVERKYLEEKPAAVRFTGILKTVQIQSVEHNQNKKADSE